MRYPTCATIFAQGDRCAGVMYIERGRVTLLATSAHGRQAAVGILGAGAFFGEGAFSARHGDVQVHRSMLSVVLGD